MWKEQMIKDIEKTRFNHNRLFKTPSTIKFITRNEYINLVLDEFLDKQKQLIIFLGGLEHLKTLESNLENLKELIPLSCNQELTKALLTYIYWKYKNPKSKLGIKVNMKDAKSAVGLDNIFIEKLTTPIHFNSDCHMCTSNTATVYIPSYEHNRIIFKCSSCGHFYETASGGNFKIKEFDSVPYTKCNCKHCNNIKDRIYKKGIDWFNNLKIICTNLFNKNIITSLEVPDDDIMRSDFHNYFTRKYDEDIMRVMNSTPSSLDELYKIISNTVQENSDTKSFHSILFKLKENNFLYDIKQKKSQMELLLIDFVFGGYHDVNNLEFENFSNYIISGDFINYYAINELKNDSDIKYSTKSGWHWMACRNFNIIDDINVDKINDYMYDDTMIINHYFIEPYIDDIRENLIIEINEIIKNCSEIDLKLILETAKAIKSIDK